MQDRLQSTWRYANREIWRPLFKRYEEPFVDLPIAVVRTMLDRPRGLRPVFVDADQFADLDRMRQDVATFLDSPADARGALWRIKPEFFIDGFAIAYLFAEIDEALNDYVDEDLKSYYHSRIERFIDRHQLPYRLDLNPLKLTPLLTSEIEALYQALRNRVGANENLREALAAFENAWERQANDWNQINAKAAIREAVLLAESMLISASNGGANEFNRVLQTMRHENRFPSDDFVNIFDRAYAFANNYPNIRHHGNINRVRRDLRREDTILSALVFIGLSACAHDLCGDRNG